MPVARVPLTASDVKRQAAALRVRPLRHRAGGRARRSSASSASGCDAGYAGEMDYLHRSARTPRATSAQVLPSARSVIVFGTVYNTDRPYSTETADTSAGGRSRATPGATTITSSSSARLERMVEWLRERSGRRARGARLRRHRPGPGARLRAARRPRLDRQEHLRDQPRARLLDFPVGDHLQSGCSRPMRRARPVRDLHAVPRGVPDRRADRRPYTLDLDAVPVVPDDRDEGRDPARSSATRSRARLRLRHLSGSLSVECAAPAVSARSGVAATRRPRSSGRSSTSGAVGR